MDLTPAEKALFFPFYFISLWMLLAFIISRFGWNGFAERYPTLTRPEGKSFNCPSARFRIFLASYRNVMRVVFAESGIYVYPFFLFRPFHRPFLLPWELVEMKKIKGLFGYRYELEVRDSFGEIHIILSKSAAITFEARKLSLQRR